MPCEIWAVDAGAGEAVLQSLDGWYLLSIHADWRPVVLNPEEVLNWSLAGRSVAVGWKLRSLQEAVILARRMCLAALSRQATGFEGWKELLQEFGWMLEVIDRYGDRLDQYFKAHGRSKEESFQLSLGVLSSLQGSRYLNLEGEELPLRLLEILQASTTAEASQGVSDERQPLEIRSVEEGRLTKALPGLSWEELSCLTIWADVGTSTEQVASLLLLTREQVERTLDGVAEKLRRPLERLKDPRLEKDCQRAVRIRVRGAAGR